ncbi:DISARM system SNF2-like helicase DrmD [Minwuia thermotolerans]|uniref:DISARM system SNF2-like helicase DrmD n=1 Tax=Minwuia thermotolerans TaxID=2056226 RepID=UPI000D6DC4A1|nr:DISARM system SNF2-like helicase DrmD [Minwuia thermotolerans]
MQLPQPGEFVILRGRRWLAEGQSSIGNGLTTLRLACVEDDAQGEIAEVVWDAEIAPVVEREEPWERIAREGSDSLDAFTAYLRTVRWNTATAADRRLLQAPFRAGIRLDPYQLSPLRKALQLPRVNLLVADDVGLGKTIEAGLILREMLLRRRVDFTVFAAPPSMTQQWRDELASKFGISATIIDREHLAQVRRRRGFQANPWATGSFFILSHRLLNDETYVSGLREILGTTRARSMLILDEAHHAAPASGARYAIDSQFTRAVRDLAPRFEHRLFLTATPHNGHSNSFAALLEMLDPQRFTRGVPVRKGDLEPVMVRRLKSDLRAVGIKFPDRKVEPVVLDGLPADTPELALSDMLLEYGELRSRRVARLTPRQRAEAKLVYSGLQQRLLSSIAAFQKTLGVHRRTMERWRERDLRAPMEAAEQFAVGAAEIDENEEDQAEQTLLDQLETEENSAAEAASIRGTEGAESEEIDAEITLVDRMLALAGKHLHKPDARVRSIVDWIRQNLVTDGAWNRRRVIIFTEFEDTRRWLETRLLEALDNLEPEDRILTFTGTTGSDRREQVKHAFNSDPDEYPVRILICTDAAREGINLQQHCYDLFHFDLPWNPSRLEQRNGRIDRKLQPAPAVYCRYFLYPQREIDRVLQVLVEKTETIREELGAIGDVLDQRISKRLTEGGITRDEIDKLTDELDSDDDDEFVARARDEIDEGTEKRRQDLRAEIDRIRRVLDESRKRFGVGSDDLQQVIGVALESMQTPLDTHGAETVGPTRTFSLEPSDRAFANDHSWLPIFDELRERPRRPGESLNEWRRTAPPRRIAFEPAILEDGRDAPHVVQVHLEHRLVRRLLSRFISQGFRGGLQRACVVQGPGSQPRVILVGRLSLFGPGASRLHEVIIPVAAVWREADRERRPLRPLAEKGDAANVSFEELEAALRQAHPVPQNVVDRLIGGAQSDVADLRGEFERRAAEHADRAERDLEAVGEGEAETLRMLLEQQRERIEKRINDPALKQMMLDFGDDEVEQARADQRHWQRRLTELEREIAEEPARLRESYEVRAQRLEPVGVVYLWPGTG